MHRTDVVVFGRKRPKHTQKSRRSSSSTPHLMGHGPGRPVKTRGRSHRHVGGRSCSSSSAPNLMGSAPGRASEHVCLAERHIWVTYRADISWAAVRPGASNFERMGRGPARPTSFSKVSPRPGPSPFSDRPGPAHAIGP